MLFTVAWCRCLDLHVLGLTCANIETNRDHRVQRAWWIIGKTSSGHVAEVGTKTDDPLQMASMSGR